MRVIVPGGFYSHDSAQKKIWLDYSYYGLGVENVESIRNLTRNSIIYSVKRSIPGITFSNGCITYSRECYSEDSDKLQIVLRAPIEDALELLEATEGVITLDTSGKVLVLPTENAAILPVFNEYVLNPNRLSITESPFGGLKGAGSPDYAPGTLYTPTDGVYLTDITGQNSTKTLTVGKLKELGYLTVDTTVHTITQEFTVQNDGDNNPTVIDNCDATTNWNYGTGGVPRGTVSLDNTVYNSAPGSIKLDVTTGGGTIYLIKTVSLDLSTTDFITYWIRGPSGKAGGFAIYCPDVSNRLRTTGITYNGQWQKFVFPIRALPKEGTPVLNNVTAVRFEIPNVAVIGDILNVDSIAIDNAKQAYIEAQVPDNLSATSLALYTHNGTAYQLASTHSLDGAYSQVSQTSANATLLDNTKFDDVYGAAGAGRAVFPKGESGETKAGSSGNITYSANKGTSKRIGFRVDLPPSDNGRTNFNKCRIKTILTYAPNIEGNYSASYDFADSTNTSYGLQNITKPWLALYDPSTSLIDFYLHTNRPQALSYKRDETGTIHELSLYPGSGSIYHGQITFADLTLDSDSDLIPDCLEAPVNGSITQFLKNYGMVI